MDELNKKILAEKENVEIAIKENYQYCTTGIK